MQRSCSPGCTLCDLGCGRGGDVHKALHAGVRSYTGVDTSPESIKEAKRRCHNMKKQISLTNFLNKDMFEDDLSFLGNFECVVCNFALHYARSFEHINTFFRNCSSILVPGGKLAVSLPSFGTISEIKSGYISDLTNIKVTFLYEGELKDFEEYEFSMKDAVAFNKEFAISGPSILQVACSNGLDLFEKGSFSDLIAPEDNTVDVSKFYMYFIFQKPAS